MSSCSFISLGRRDVRELRAALSVFSGSHRLVERWNVLPQSSAGQTLRDAQSPRRTLMCRRTRHRSPRDAIGWSWDHLLRCFSHSRSVCSEVAFTNALMHPHFSPLVITHHHSLFTKPHTVAPLGHICASDARPCTICQPCWRARVCGDLCG